MRFEEAQEIKLKLESLENYQSKSTIVSTKIHNVDVFSIVSDEEYAYINFLQVAHGAIVRGHTLEVKKKLEETDQELLELGIVELRERFRSNSKELIVPFPLSMEFTEQLTVPKAGEKFQLLQLSERNAQAYRQEKFQAGENH